MECPKAQALAPILLRVQHELFNLGSILATLPEDVHPKQARITAADVTQLEVEMDRMNQDLPPLRRSCFRAAAAWTRNCMSAARFAAVPSASALRLAAAKIFRRRRYSI